MEFYQRLQSAIERAEANKYIDNLSDLSRRVGAPAPSSIDGIIKNKRKSSKYTAKLAKELKVSLAWLADGQLPMESPPLIPTQNTVAVDHGSDKSNTHRNIARYDVKLSAGSGTAEWIVRENDDDPIYFRKGWFKAKRLYAESLRGMYVRGDSMESYLFNNDTVIIDVDDTELTDGDTYAIIFKDNFYVKELRGIDGEVSIISKNKKYEAMQTSKNESSQYNNYFQILGRVVWRGG